MRRLLTLVLVSAMAAVSLVAAAPASALPIKPRPSGPTPMPAQILAYGTAVCLVTVGRWQITWQFELKGDEARIISARDHVNNNTLLSFTTTPLTGVSIGTHTAVGGLAAPITTAGLTAEILVTGEATPRRVVRTLAMGAPCASESTTPDCTSVSNARYAHAFDGVAGTTTVEIVGPRLCSGLEQFFVFESWYRHNPGNIFRNQALNFTRFTSAVRRIAMSTVTSPGCVSRVMLAVGLVATMDPNTGALLDHNIAGGDKAPGSRSTGPFAANVVDAGTCLAPKAYANAQCDGSLAITVTNGPEAAMPATILFSPAQGGIDIFRWISVPPGGSVTVRLAKPGVTPLGFHVQAGSTVLGTFFWSPTPACRPLKPRVPRGSGVARRYSI